MLDLSRFRRLGCDDPVAVCLVQMPSTYRKKRTMSMEAQAPAITTKDQAQSGEISCCPAIVKLPNMTAMHLPV